MGKYYCEYCQSYLTYGSRSVRKNHLHGKHHLKLYFEYYEKIAQEFPELDSKSFDPTTESSFMKEMYKGIPGSNNEIFKGEIFTNNTNNNNNNNNYNERMLFKFKLKVPNTTIELPNPPPNAICVNYSNLLHRNRINKPYYKFNNYNYSNNNSNNTHPHNHNYITKTKTSRETTPINVRTHVGNERLSSPINSNTVQSNIVTKSEIQNKPIQTGPEHGYGYGYGQGYDSGATPIQGYRNSYGKGNRGGYNGGGYSRGGYSRGGSNSYRGKPRESRGNVTQYYNPNNGYRNGRNSGYYGNNGNQYQNQRYY